MKPGSSFAGKVLLTTVLLMPAFAVADNASRSCELQEAMNDRRQEVRKRNVKVLNEGISKRNSEALAELNMGVNFDICSDLFDTEIQRMFSGFSGFGFFSRFIGNKLKSECRKQVREVSKSFDEILDRELEEINDPFGILEERDVPYNQNRTKRVTVADAIEAGRQVGNAAKGVPINPPGRGQTPQAGQQAPEQKSSGFAEGVKNAILGL